MAEFSPVYSLDEETLTKLVDMGLGKGIDSTKNGQRLLDLQLQPSKVIVEQLTTRSGYQTFFSEIASHSSLTKDMSSQLAIRSPVPLQIAFSTEVKRKEESRMVRIAQGQQILTRTVRFKIREIQRAPEAIDHEDGNESGEEAVPLSTLEALLEEQVKAEGLNYSSGESIPADKRTQISLDVLVNKNRGATHFVSSVDLGAKIFQIKSKTTKTVTKTTSASASADGGSTSVAGDLKLQFNDTYLDMASSNVKNIHAVVDPAVRLKQMKTMIFPQHERVIALEISPISQIIRNKFWRESVIEACKQYAEDSILKVPAMIGTGGPFVIKADDYYFKVNDDRSRVQGTANPHDADCFYIYTDDTVIRDVNPDVNSESEADPLDEPDVGFYIYYKTPGGQKMFLTADSTSEVVFLCTRTTVPATGKFYLEFPGSQTMAKLSDWPSMALHILRKTAFLRRHQYLVLKERDPDAFDGSSRMQSLPRRDDNVESLVLHAVVGGRTVAAEGSSRCQFVIRNGGLPLGHA
jgi:hypothetical protein